MRDLSMRKDFLVTEQLQSQKKLLKLEEKRCTDLLRSLLPRQIIASALMNDPVVPELFQDVTVVFIEICGFHRLCAQLSPETVVEVLNVIYHEFDRLSDLLDVYKVETVGEVYMAVVGCPEIIINHADVAAHFALAAQESMPHMRDRLRCIAGLGPVSADAAKLALEAALPEQLAADLALPATLPAPSPQPCITGDVGSGLLVRIGLNSGKIRAGVVGLAAPRYKLVGDTVNTASRMESTCVPGRIQLSPTTQERLTDGLFVIEPRGEVPVKGKGTMVTSFLNGYIGGSHWPREVHLIHSNFGRRGSLDGGMSMPGMSRGPSLLSWIDEGSHEITHAAEEALDIKKWPSLAQRHASFVQWHAIWRHLAPDDDADTTKQKPMNNMSIDQLLLLASEGQKQPKRLALLIEDLPRYLADSLPARMYGARVLTIGWLLFMTAISVFDIFMQEESRQTLETMLVRSVCNHMVGLLYLLFIASGDHEELWLQGWTIVMLLIQGGSVLFGSSLAFKSEPTLVALYGVWVLFYSVCTILQRLAISVIAVASFMVLELARCDDTERFQGVFEKFVGNVVFLIAFFVFMACSVRLKEFLGHVANYDHCFIDKQLEKMDGARSARSQLLASLLPEHVAEKVLEGVSPIAEPCEQVTMLFTDIKGFTAYAADLAPQDLVDLLNSMYSAFDEIIVSWELYKVDVIGDAYFVTAGCPPSESLEDRVEPEECAMRAVEVGLAMLRTLPTLPWGSAGTQLDMRVGLHTGSVVAGVVGKKGPRYHLFGAAVGYANQMESTGQPGRVHISDDTCELLRAGGYSYEFEEAWVEVEGLQEKARTWHVNRSKDNAAQKIQTGLLRQRAKRRGCPDPLAPTSPPLGSPRRTRASRAFSVGHRGATLSAL
ncbi:unnamed protein product [Prorocentrum cordatum]|nr:unnamed protein product [Polarella glacialis]